MITPDLMREDDPRLGCAIVVAHEKLCGTQRPSSAAFLLAQLGSHAAGKFAERLARLRLSPPHAGILGVLRKSGGLSQQALAEVLHMHPSGLVAIIDELEVRGLVKRQNSLDDRRTYELHLTDKGQVALRDIGRIAQEHNESLCAALSPSEREELTGFLQRVADSQGLTPGVHPGFSRLGRRPKRPG
jgi:DNA-binding MarR family transcriptional regulator